MDIFWKTKFKKGIKYYQEHGLGAFCAKVVASIVNMVLDKYLLYYYYRVSSQFRMALDRMGMLKRVRPYEGIPQVIVSLTSYPARINTVHQAIQTLLVQTYQADRVILWLAEDEFPGGEDSLPPRLRKLCARGVEIRWCENLRSYKKLIPTLETFPDAITITFDDDLLYNKYHVERLIAAYIAKPDYMHCHWAAMMVYHTPDCVDRALDDKNGYRVPSYLNELVGCGGCLYPPHCFHTDITNRELFMTLAPTNDDLWFWLMGVLNGYRVNIVENNISRLVYIPGTQEIGLCRINSEGEKLLFVQLKNILRYYPELGLLLANEQRLVGMPVKGGDPAK